MSDTLHLVLTRHWYDDTAAGRKRVEYRSMKNPANGKPSVWYARIWLKRYWIKTVRFSRAYTSTTQAHRRIHGAPSWARANGFLK